MCSSFPVWVEVQPVLPPAVLVVAMLPAMTASGWGCRVDTREVVVDFLDRRCFRRPPRDLDVWAAAHDIAGAGRGMQDNPVLRE